MIQTESTVRSSVIRDDDEDEDEHDEEGEGDEEGRWSCEVCQRGPTLLERGACENRKPSDQSDD